MASKTRTGALLGLMMGAAAFGLGLGGTAHASIVQTCQTGATPAFGGTGDVSLTVAGLTSFSSACQNIAQQSGLNAEVTALNNAFGTSFLYLDKTNEPQGTAAGLGGLRFTVSAPGTTSGSWTVTWTDTNLVTQPNLPIQMDLIVGLKGANEIAAYLIEDVIFTAPGGVGTGFFEISFTNNGGQIPGLSHLTLLGGNFTAVPPTTQPPLDVPEPATLALLGTGLLGLGLVRRRRKVAA